MIGRRVKITSIRCFIPKKEILKFVKKLERNNEELYMHLLLIIEEYYTKYFTPRQKAKERIKRKSIRDLFRKASISD